MSTHPSAGEIASLLRAVAFLDLCCTGEARLCPPPTDYRYKDCRETELRIYRRWRREAVVRLRRWERSGV